MLMSMGYFLGEGSLYTTNLWRALHTYAYVWSKHDGKMCIKDPEALFHTHTHSLRYSTITKHSSGRNTICVHKVDIVNCLNGGREEGGGGGCFYFSNHSIPCPSVPYFEGTLPSHCEHILVESCIRNRTAIVLSNIMQHVLGSNYSVCIGSYTILAHYAVVFMLLMIDPSLTDNTLRITPPCMHSHKNTLQFTCI